MEQIAKLSSSSATLMRDLYARMIYVRLVDEYSVGLHQQDGLRFVASCAGHEAAQVGSACCIEVGRDFTLPYYRDLGVVLTIGMTPYEIFRSYLQRPMGGPERDERPEAARHWGYHKHHTITGPAPVATQILHAAGVAFSCKLRGTGAVTIAYCGDGATAEPDFLEGVNFAAHHRLPAVFICEHEGSQPLPVLVALPVGLAYQTVDGSDVLAVHAATQAALQCAREGRGPLLLDIQIPPSSALDPLRACQQRLQALDDWDEQWAEALQRRIRVEVSQALEDALRDDPSHS